MFPSSPFPPPLPFRTLSTRTPIAKYPSSTVLTVSKTVSSSRDSKPSSSAASQCSSATVSKTESSRDSLTSFLSQDTRSKSTPLSSTVQDEHIKDEHNLDDIDDVEDYGDPMLSTKKGKKKREAQSLRKAPQAPKRFKSSYICFFMAKQSEIKAELGDAANVTSVSKRSAEMWKNLPPTERAHWDEVAAKDKQRFMNEKASYTGPWQVPWKRVKKDPSAPRRPMSAFLFYSIGKRQQIKKENPEMKNTEISRQLGEMWRSLSEKEKRPFVETEKKEREKYKLAMAKWRQESQAKKEEQRKSALQQQTMVNAMQEQQQMYADPNQMTPALFYGTYPLMYPAASPFQLPTNGKQPVILGANGMPVAMPAAKTQQPAYQHFDAAQAQAFNEFTESGGEAAP